MIEWDRFFHVQPELAQADEPQKNETTQRSSEKKAKTGLGDKQERRTVHRSRKKSTSRSHLEALFSPRVRESVQQDDYSDPMSQELSGKQRGKARSLTDAKPKGAPSQKTAAKIDLSACLNFEKYCQVTLSKDYCSHLLVLTLVSLRGGPRNSFLGATCWSQNIKHVLNTRSEIPRPNLINGI